jgi:hypothetical protein
MNIYGEQVFNHVVLPSAGLTEKESWIKFGSCFDDVALNNRYKTAIWWATKLDEIPNNCIRISLMCEQALWDIHRELDLDTANFDPGVDLPVRWKNPKVKKHIQTWRWPLTSAKIKWARNGHTHPPLIKSTAAHSDVKFTLQG